MPEVNLEHIERLIERAVRKAMAEVVLSWPRWLKTTQAARYSGLSAKTLRRLAREGEIKAYRHGKDLVFDRESIDQYFLRQEAEVQAHFEEVKKRLFS